MKRDSIDWHMIPERQLAMHDRLLNWARWCRGPSSADVSPMFRLYRATDANQGDGQRYGLRSTVDPVDSRDATKIARGVGLLPEPHRLSLQWFYVRPVAPARACREIATTQAGLVQLVHDGRCMLINRRV